MPSKRSHTGRMQLSASQIRAIAVEAMVDPRTVKKMLEGKPVMPMPKLRIQAALERLMRLGK